MREIGEKRASGDGASLSSLECVSKKGKLVFDDDYAALTEPSEKEEDVWGGAAAKMLDNMPVDVVSNEACKYRDDYWNDSLQRKLRIKEFQLFYAPNASGEVSLRYSIFYTIPNSFLDDKNYDKLYNAVSEHIQSCYISFQDACVIAERVRCESFPQMSTHVARMAAGDHVRDLKWNVRTEEYIRLYSKLWDGTFNNDDTFNDRLKNYWKVVTELYDDRDSYPNIKKSVEEEFCSKGGIPIFAQKFPFILSRLEESNGDWMAVIREFFTTVFGRRVVFYADYVTLKICLARKLGIAR